MLCNHVRERKFRPDVIGPDAHTDLFDVRRAYSHGGSRHRTSDGGSGMLSLVVLISYQVTGGRRKDVHTGPCAPMRLVVIAQP